MRRRCGMSGSPCAQACGGCSRQCRWRIWRPASYPSMCARSRQTLTPGRPTSDETPLRVEGGLARWLDEDDLAAIELESLRFVARQLHGELLAVVARQLDA